MNTHAARHRLIFFPNRLDPDGSISEFRDRNRHRDFGITLKQTFGGGSGVAKSQ